LQPGEKDERNTSDGGHRGSTGLGLFSVRVPKFLREIGAAQGGARQIARAAEYTMAEYNAYQLQPPKRVPRRN
jgi:hypothetical protein